MRLSLTASVAAIMTLVGSAQADILWDQSAIDLGPASAAVPNSVSPGFNGWTIFGLSDMTVPASGWTVQSVTTYFSALSWNPGSVTQGVLNVFPKVGNSPLATNDPRAAPTGQGTLLAVSMTNTSVGGNGVWEIMASGLNINLAAGEYWIGLTPVGPAGPFGPDRQWSTPTLVGAGHQMREYPGTGWQDAGPAFGMPSFDTAILVQGAVPAPAGLALIAMGGLVAGRRRRA